MSYLPHRCRYNACEDQQVHGHLCEKHYRLVNDSRHDVDYEPAEEQ